MKVSVGFSQEVSVLTGLRMELKVCFEYLMESKNGSRLIVLGAVSVQMLC